MSGALWKARANLAATMVARACRIYMFLGTKDGAVNRCGQISRNLKSNIPGSELVWMRGPKRTFPRRHEHHKKYNDLAKDWHVALHFNGLVIDLSRRQFEPLSKFPHVQTLERARAEWSELHIQEVKP